MTTLRAVQANIVSLDVDVIVNAANTSLLGGSGVDGAIHRAAGPELIKECRTLQGCKVGHAKITKGYRLPARHIIHTVGPVWNGGSKNEENLLASCYQESLSITAAQGFRTIAFPCISTGIYRFPLQLAAEIAIRTTKTFFLEPGTLEEVIFCCFSGPDLAVYQKLLEAKKEAA